MSASEKIARLRELRKKAELSRPTMLTWEREIVDALPALLECAEAVQGVAEFLGEYIDRKQTVDVKVALAFETARAALQALAQIGENNA